MAPRTTLIIPDFRFYLPSACMHTCADLIFLHQGNSPSKLSVQRTKPFLPRTQKGWRYSSDIGMGQNAWLFFVGGVLTLPSSPSERRRQIASPPHSAPYAPCFPRKSVWILLRPPKAPRREGGTSRRISEDHPLIRLEKRENIRIGCAEGN